MLILRLVSPLLLLMSLTLVALPLGALPVADSSATPSFEDCLGLPDADRLACYDRIATLNTAQQDKQNVWDEAISANEVTNHSHDKQPEVSASVEAASEAEELLPESDLVKEAVGLSTASPMEKAWELREDTRRSAFSLQAYQPNYILFAQYANRVNRRPASPSPGHLSASAKDYRHVEAKFRLSIKSKLAQDLLRENDSLWFGYSQISQWQVWSGHISRPFRSTSYQPELIYVTPIQYKLPHTSWTLRMASLGLIHESNGQSDPLSRSWNRVYIGFGFDSDRFSVYSRLWKRIPESRHRDDNPDITTYMGRADVRVSWDFAKGNTVGLTLTNNLRDFSKGSLQLDYYFPLSRLWGMGDKLRGYIQVFHGYGETITDYNFRRSAIGFGVAIKEW